MSTIHITSTTFTPAIYFNPSKGILDIKGRSSPENTPSFYSPIKSAINTDLNADRLNVRLRLEYFNTSSSKCLFDILRSVKSIQETGKEVNIKWYYEEDDEDMMEAGEDYSEILDLPFVFVEYATNLRRK